MRKLTRVSVFTLASLALGATTNSEKPSDKDPRFQSDFKVVIDEAAAEDNHVEPEKLNAEVKKFLDAHDAFSLTDLQNLKIRAPGGRDVLLQEVASIQVEFRRRK